MDHKRKSKNHWWKVSKLRQLWIADADRLTAEAADLIESPGVEPFLEKHHKLYKRAGILYRKSGNFYRRAGLGLMAQGAYQDAAECFASVGDEDQCRECERIADGIEPYYDGEDE